MTSKALLPFLLITFGLTWGILALYFFMPTGMEQTVGPLTSQQPALARCATLRYVPADRGGDPRGVV